MVIAIDCRALQDHLGGGVAEYARHLIKVLLKEDKENEYVLFTTGIASSQDLMNGQSPTNDANIRGIRGASTREPICEILNLSYPNKLLNFAMRFLKWPKLDVLLKRRIGKKIDLLLVPNINFICVSASCPYILVVHDLSFEHFPEFFSLKRRIWHYLVQPKKLVHAARTVVAVSEYTKRDVMELYGVAADKVKVVYPGIAQSRISQSQDCTNGQSPTNDTNIRGIRGASATSPLALSFPYILYLGTLEPRKNIEGLIQAFELLCGCHPERSEGSLQASLRDSSATPQNDSHRLSHLVIAGRPGWLYQSIYCAVVQSPVRDRIHMLGAVTEEQKAALYRGATCFVYPSFYEGFGFPPLEAASYGVPVITSASSSLPEVIGDAALLVDPTNVAQIAYAMERVLTDEALRDNCIQKGGACAARFTWGSCARAIPDLYRS